MGQLEIERKFVLEQIPRQLLAGLAGERIRQGYLLRDREVELRIRQREQDCFMTVKRGSGLARHEQECTIPAAQFAMLWPLTGGRQLEKTRYTVRQGEHLLEIDVFAGRLEPLVLLEVEFPTIEAAQAFDRPAFIKFEVTADRAYKNAALASRGLPESFIRAFGLAGDRGKKESYER